MQFNLKDITLWYFLLFQEQVVMYPTLSCSFWIILWTLFVLYRSVSAFSVKATTLPSTITYRACILEHVDFFSALCRWNNNLDFLPPLHNTLEKISSTKLMNQPLLPLLVAVPQLSISKVANQNNTSATSTIKPIISPLTTSCQVLWYFYRKLIQSFTAVSQEVSWIDMQVLSTNDCVLNFKCNNIHYIVNVEVFKDKVIVRIIKI